jgi:hypothetical protein
MAKPNEVQLDRSTTTRRTAKTAKKSTYSVQSFTNKRKIVPLATSPRGEKVSTNKAAVDPTNKRSTNNQRPNKVSKEKPLHPIAAAIDRCLARISDVRYSLKFVMSYVANSRIKEIDKAKKELLSHAELLRKDVISGASQAIAIKTMLESMSRLNRYERSELLPILAAGHFLTLFSSLDAFTGELLTALYRKKPGLYCRLNRAMTVAEMLQYSNVDDIKDIVLKSEIEAFRRKSYVEQFEMLENQFGLTLTKFKHWPEFVECTQRRNLFTHCDGYVSDQYISICGKHGFPFSGEIKEGTRLHLEPHYLIHACGLSIEVTLKLGQTLWRKVLPEEIEEADDHLQRAQFDFLEREEWGSACMAGEFALSLPEHSTGVLKTIMAINYAIALFRCNETKQAMAVLDAIDWTALCFDFRLAERVLRHDYKSAKKLMIKIGKSGEFFIEQSYLSWPLFWDFRQSKEFAEGYKTVFGYDFADKLQMSATETQNMAKDEIQKEMKDSTRLLESVNANGEEEYHS